MAAFQRDPIHTGLDPPTSQKAHRIDIHLQPYPRLRFRREVAGMGHKEFKIKHLL
jgi:hypothetical protein